jgi:hypothetical protein
MRGYKCGVQVWGTTEFDYEGVQVWGTTEFDYEGVQVWGTTEKVVFCGSTRFDGNASYEVQSVQDIRGFDHYLIPTAVRFLNFSEKQIKLDFYF